MMEFFQRILIMPLVIVLAIGNPICFVAAIFMDEFDKADIVIMFLGNGLPGFNVGYFLLGIT